MTWQGIEVGKQSALLNGLYRGQFDQSGSGTWLIMNGNVIGYDTDFGYLGYLNFDPSSQQFDAQLWRFPIISNLYQTQLVSASGRYISQTWQGIRFYSQNNQISLVGDYSMPTSSGSLLLNQVNLMTMATSISGIVDQWQLGQHQLFITDLGSNGRFQGFNSELSGCRYQGLISIAQGLANSYQVDLVQQVGCESFNGGPAQGFAILDDQGDWQWFLQRGRELAFQRFTRLPSTTTDDSSTNTEPTDADDLPISDAPLDDAVPNEDTSSVEAAAE